MLETVKKITAAVLVSQMIVFCATETPKVTSFDASTGASAKSDADMGASLPMDASVDASVDANVRDL